MYVNCTYKKSDNSYLVDYEKLRKKILEPTLRAMRDSSSI